MGGKTKGGNKARKLAKNNTNKRFIFTEGPGQYYGIVEKCNSHSSIAINYVNEKQEFKKGNGIIRGKLIKRIRKINVGQIVIVSERDFETSKEIPKIDIIHVYRADEMNGIYKYLPSQIKTVMSGANKHETEIEFNSAEFQEEDDMFAEYINNTDSRDLPPMEEDVIYVSKNDKRLEAE